ncbi:MAG TPA: hypothetical protein VGH90_07325, partial [Chthoniobacteraceae bacterium]
MESSITEPKVTETKRTRVAVIEDHPMFRERLAQIINAEDDLEMGGEAESCEEALRLVRETEPDLA